jgi:Tfp pilus assembly protein PilF
MSEKGFFEEGATVEVFVRGKIIEARPPAVAVRDDDEDEMAIDEAGRENYRRALGRLRDGDTAAARRIMEELLRLHPDIPRLLTGVAVLREAGGEPVERYAPLIRRAAEIDPDDPHARTGLARLYAREGQTEKARETLQPLLELKQMQRSEWNSLVNTQSVIAKAEREARIMRRVSKPLKDDDSLT